MVVCSRQSGRCRMYSRIVSPFGCTSGSRSIGRRGRSRSPASLFPYDPNHQTFVNIYDGDALTAGHPRSPAGRVSNTSPATRQGILAVVRRFVSRRASIHILIGPDQPAVPRGLLLLGGTVRQLALVVTAFTVAHSITLDARRAETSSTPSGGGSSSRPSRLSIVYVGADNLMVHGGT